MDQSTAVVGFQVKPALPILLSNRFPEFFGHFSTLLWSAIFRFLNSAAVINKLERIGKTKNAIQKFSASNTIVAMKLLLSLSKKEMPKVFFLTVNFNDSPKDVLYLLKG